MAMLAISPAQVKYLPREKRGETIFERITWCGVDVFGVC